MIRHIVRVVAPVVVPVVLFCLSCGAAISVAASSVAASAEASPPIPVPLPTEHFREVLVQAGDNLFIAGQPTEAGLAEMADKGVVTVVNLRTDREMDNRDVVPFDEAAAVRALGLDYVHIPSGGPDTPYEPDMVAEFAAAMDAADGKVLLHCTVAWRASHLYVSYLHRYRGLTLDEAIRHGQAINFGTLPLEGFLGTPLTIRTDAQSNTQTGKQTDK